MRQTLVTYDIFCQAVQAMQDQGEKISVRTILSHTGGSFSKIAEFLKRWRGEQAHVESQIDRELSPNLRQAILAEIGKAVTETKNTHEKQLSQTNEQLEEANEVLVKQENLLEEQEQQIIQLNQQIAITAQMQAQQAEKIQVLEKKLEETITAQHQADKQAAIAETRCVELEKQLAKQERGADRQKA